MPGRLESLQGIVERAESHEKSFHWLEAAKAYEETLPFLAEKDPRKAEVTERIAFSFFCTAMQSKNIDQFRKRLRWATTSYRQALARFRRSRGPRNPWGLRCRAMDAYVNSWLARSPSVKERLLDRSWEFSKESMHGFAREKADFEYARTYNQTSVSAALGLQFDRAFKVRTRRVGEAVEHGRRAVELLSSLPDRRELTRTYVRTALFLDLGAELGWQTDKIKEHDREALEYWNKGLRLHRKGAVSETFRPPPVFCRILRNEEANRVCEEAMRLAEQAKDWFATGWLLDQLARGTWFQAIATEEPRPRRELQEKALRLAEEAASRFDSFGFTSPNSGVLWVHSPYAEYFLEVSSWEFDPERKRLLLEKSLEAARELVARAGSCGYPKVRAYSHHVTSKTALALSRLEENPLRKRKLLRLALSHRKQSVEIIDQINPDDYWNRGTLLKYLGEVQSELAQLVENPTMKITLLLEALRSKETACRMYASFLESRPIGRSSYHALNLGLSEYEQGDILNKLYGLEGVEERLQTASKAYLKAAGWYSTLPLHSRMAECYWKAAQTFDRLTAYSTASENFEMASKSYEDACSKISLLSEVYGEYVQYLRAWGRIERARSFHGQQNYDESAKMYEEAAVLHRATRRWKFLAPYYSAWARLESGESLSRNGKSSEATFAFRQAASLFNESSVSILKDSSWIAGDDEKEEFTRLASSPREQYCQARALMEEASSAERLWDHETSSEKFGLAAGRLRECGKLCKSDDERGEMEFIATIAEAWRLMTQASRGGADSIRKACQLLEKAKELSQNQKARLLASAHSHYFRAVEATAKFTETFDRSDYEVAVNSLGTAIEQYQESGFGLASEGARGSRLLLDAYVQIASGNRAVAQKAKAADYNSARILLRNAADSFERALQPARREQVLRILERVDTDWELSSRLVEMSNAITDLSSTVAFPTLAQSGERAVGLGRFERPDIESKLETKVICSSPSLSLELTIGIVNTGRVPVRLVRMEEAVPEGTQLLEAPDNCKRDGRSLGLNLRRVKPLGMETLSIVLGSKLQGLVRINPRIIFVDESGAQWQRDVQPRLVVTSQILKLLARAFVEDFNTKGLAAGFCGWRTLMEIAHGLKIPRSQLYGDRRYGHVRGTLLEALLKSSLAESRIFPGGRGRGENITKVRIQYENKDMKNYVDELLNVA